MSIPELSPSAIAIDFEPAYRYAGAAILRGAIPQEVVGRARAQWTDALATFEEKASELAEGRLSDDYQFHPQVSLFARYHFIQYVVLRLMQRSGEMASVIEQIAASCLGLVSFVEGKSSIRRQGSRSTPVPWHRDAAAVKTLEDANNCANFWMPLDEVGVVRPSLQIAVGSATDWQSRPVEDSDHEAPQDVERNYSIATAMLEPGDLLIFNHHTLHRTQPMQNGSSRLSGEFRFAIR
jgi:hypothetical protein